MSLTDPVAGALGASCTGSALGIEGGGSVAGLGITGLGASFFTISSSSSSSLSLKRLLIFF